MGSLNIHTMYTKKEKKKTNNFMHVILITVFLGWKESSPGIKGEKEVNTQCYENP